MNQVRAGVLDIAYFELGPADGVATILLHGFPYDEHAYDEVASTLAASGHRCIVPFLRGYGATRFLSPTTPRSGEQAALGADLLSLMDALGIEKAILGGYDWGGRAACIVSALWPERVIGLVSAGAGYNIQDIAGTANPGAPDREARHWYQYYFHIERGRKGPEQQRRQICRFLRQTWSPPWSFDDATFERSAASFGKCTGCFQSIRKRWQERAKSSSAGLLLRQSLPRTTKYRPSGVCGYEGLSGVLIIEVSAGHVRAAPAPCVLHAGSTPSWH